MTRLCVAYDIERRGECLRASRRLIELHQRLGVPATLFIVGELLEDPLEGPEWRALLTPGVQSGLFEVASHSWSHKLLRPARNGDPQVSDEERLEEIDRGKESIEQAFGVPCLGFRPANGWPDGLLSDGWLRTRIARRYSYVSSRLWGDDYAPAPLRSPHPYATPWGDELWELPATGKHDTHVWAEHGGRTDGAQGFLFKMEYRGHLLSAVKDRVPYTSFIWHPWQLAQFGESMAHVEGVLESAREWLPGFGFSTFAQEYARVAQREGSGGVSGKRVPEHFYAPKEEGRPDLWYDRLPDHVDNAPSPSTYRWVVDAMEREAEYIIRQLGTGTNEEAASIARELRPALERTAAAEFRRHQLRESLGWVLTNEGHERVTA